ncbi:hypothetical protein NQ315_000994 [Exocentrus adspersus]|uniref:Uncharacterized protein n=1 Tax=Exocentrus adspersus TaxID=1586481 RepID=A0AAV8WE74_9CUCU|nr:hypothetical protein NQ315_000994 [Exocentrus adspersus]
MQKTLDHVVVLSVVAPPPPRGARIRVRPSWIVLRSDGDVSGARLPHGSVADVPQAATTSRLSPASTFLRRGSEWETSMKAHPADYTTTTTTSDGTTITDVT